MVGMGVVIAGLQYLTGYRTAENADALANAFGVGIGWLLFLNHSGARPHVCRHTTVA